MYKTKQNFTNGVLLKILEAIVYIIIINFSYYIPLILNLDGKYTETNILSFNKIQIWIILFSLAILIFNKVFYTFKMSNIENIVIMIVSSLMIFISTTAIAFFYRGFALPRSILVSGILIQIVFLSLFKIIFKGAMYRFIPPKKILIFSEMENKETLICKIFSQRKHREDLCYYVTPEEKFLLKVYGEIDKVYIFGIKDRNIVDDVVKQCIKGGVQVCILPDNYEVFVRYSKLDFAADIPVLKIDKLGLSYETRFLKRTLDIVISIIGIIVFFPVMIVVAIAIFLQDGFPILFKQKRVTRGNKVYTIFKFRSMIKDAERKTGAVWAIENDKRITKLGTFLRKYWLDELPQFFNVLIGDMSFVGPRPERPELIEAFSIDIPEFKLRNTVKAGMTGYAQTVALYETTPQNKLKIDLFYIQNASILFDLQIIIGTFKKVICRLFGMKDQILYSYDDLLVMINVKEVSLNGAYKFVSVKEKI